MFRFARGLPSVEELKPTNPLFTTNRGNAYKPSYFSQYVTKEIAALYMEQKGEEVCLTPHYFCHAFAIISRLNKVDLYDIMRSLGYERGDNRDLPRENIRERKSCDS